MTQDVGREREDPREDRRREGREEDRDRRHDQELDERHADREKEPGRRGAAHEQQGVVARGHHGGIDREREDEAEILADDELMTMDRLRDDRVDRAALDLLEDEADAHEDRGQDPEQPDGRQAEILDDLVLVADGEHAHDARGRDHHEREDEQQVQDPVADRLPERCSARWRGSRSSPVTGFRERAGSLLLGRALHLAEEEVLEAAAQRDEREKPALSPGGDPAQQALERLAAPRRAGSVCPPFDWRTGPSAARRSGALERHLERLDGRRQQRGQLALTDELAVLQDPDAVADHLGVLQDVRRKEHRLPRATERQDDVAELAPPDGIEPDIGSSRTTKSGSPRSACARPTRWIIPFENFRRGRSRPSTLSATRSRRASIAARRSPEGMPMSRA
jgi:hypothetical protein